MDVNEAIADLCDVARIEAGGQLATSIGTVLARLAEVEAQLAELTETEPAWAVQWESDEPVGMNGPLVELHCSAENAKRVDAMFPRAHLRTAQTWRGPWTEPTP